MACSPEKSKGMSILGPLCFSLCVDGEWISGCGKWRFRGLWVSMEGDWFLGDVNCSRVLKGGSATHRKGG